jgi:Aerotolerance regulator N-terminal/von Willebrand factor type A domain
MSWMSALNAWQWMLMLAVPPLVFLLYFLKLRRQPIEVPSTYLWRKAIEDIHVNSLWQRLRRNLLLLLQLLFLAALILACLRPGIHGNQETGRRWILMLDNSASMQATDLSPSRLETAKAKAREQIGMMNRGDVAMLLAFSDRADIQQGFTGDTRRLLAAVDNVHETNHVTDISEALRAAAGLANPGRVSFDGMNDIQVAEALPATVFVYSDGGFPAISEFDRGNLSIEFVPIGRSTIDNVGIEAFAVSRNEERIDELDAYARLSNYSDDQVEVTASLYLDKQLIDAVRTTIEAEKESGIRFSLKDLNIDSGSFRVELDRDDQLMLDNQAFATLRPGRSLQVLVVTPGNTALEKSLSTTAIRDLANVQFESPDWLTVEAGKKADMRFESFDLAIFDQCAPVSLPPTNTLFIGSAPPGKDWSFGEVTGPIQLIDVDRTHPMTSFLELGNIRIVEAKSISVPESGRTLIRANNGPVFAVAPRGPYQDAVLGFDIVRVNGGEVAMNTDWGIKRSFPVFVFGCVEFLAGGSTQSAASNTLPGQPMAISLSSRVERYRMVDPEGKTVEVEQNEGGQLVWTETESVGVYQVQAADDQRLLDSFAVNLFSPRESNFAVSLDIEIGEEKVVASVAQARGRNEYWRWILLLGLGLLVGEWVVFNRRVLV